MECRTVDIEGLALGFDAFDWPGFGPKPQILNRVAEFIIALRGQFSHGHAFLHVRVIALQLLELQGVTRQRLDQFAEAFIAGVQGVITGIELLALGVVDAQVERIAVRLFIAILRTQT
ncbi:hypothetical protein D3C81_719070 [compost metagenome]